MIENNIRWLHMPKLCNQAITYGVKKLFDILIQLPLIGRDGIAEGPTGAYPKFGNIRFNKFDACRKLFRCPLGHHTKTTLTEVLYPRCLVTLVVAGAARRRNISRFREATVDLWFQMVALQLHSGACDPAVDAFISKLLDRDLE